MKYILCGGLLRPHLGLLVRGCELRAYCITTVKCVSLAVIRGNRESWSDPRQSVPAESQERRKNTEKKYHTYKNNRTRTLSFVCKATGLMSAYTSIRTGSIQFRLNLLKKLSLVLGAVEVALAIRLRRRPRQTVHPPRTRRIIAVNVNQKPGPVIVFPP